MKIPCPVRREYYRQLVVKFSPFLFRCIGDDIGPLVCYTGKIEMYISYTELYETTLERLYCMFSRGYVDLTYFASYYTGIRVNELSHWNKLRKALQYAPEDCRWEYWKCDDEAKKMAVSYMRQLHLFTASFFDQSCFNQAWNNFCEMIKNRSNED